MRKFLSCPFLLLLPLLFCSCGRISEQCLLIDSADTCRVTTDQKVTLIRNGLPHDYHMPSTKDFFNGQTLSSSDISADSSRIYVYRCGDKFAASRINIEHARALRNAVAAGKYSPADILPSCALWFLAAFVIGCAAYCCRATDKRIMITVGSTLAMLDTLKIAKERGAKVILVTRFPNSPGAALADIVLQCGANENPLQSGSIPARIAQMYLTDILFSEYTHRNMESVKDSRNRIAQALAAKHV